MADSYAKSSDVRGQARTATVSSVLAEQRVVYRISTGRGSEDLQSTIYNLRLPIDDFIKP